ncbi:Transcription initiation factor TFIID, subunit TAF6 (also component of histone acetyltransferase SAGA) [Phaffia rhodozyma]|uniref:Transcription initiation factor TFIID, subunit TAF6 (Also component of histone acetyltransferase SAGA) n=1 Tax=Phaffia rhodozyma TaxID=264483 RepID=A0A0F7SKT0_PHARH|nr:Transcription initiation factor TFIID, subunit TAF6 (also component of histone acetyltransferase SAGA) [Phaffia rhodozyma]
MPEPNPPSAATSVPPRTGGLLNPNSSIATPSSGSALAGSASNGIATTSAGPSSAPFASLKAKPVATAGLYTSESVRLSAESIGIAKLDESVAVALAGDVEFRLHQVIEEAHKFMKHSKRQTMLPSDVNNALEILNVEPIYGHLPLPSSSHPTFAPLRASEVASSLSKNKSSANASSTTVDQLYYLQDQEIDFAKLLQERPPGLVNGGVRWTAHWLAVEGIMPRVPENVAPDHHAYRVNPQLSSEDPSAMANGVSGSSATTAGGGSSAGIVNGGQIPINKTKPNLSQELQLYFSRLTKALLPMDTGLPAGAGTGAEGEAPAPVPVQTHPPAGTTGELTDLERARLAALASLRGDTGLQGLVVYLVRWIGERVIQNLGNLLQLSYVLDAINAILANQTLFLEPFLHQLLPPLLTPLLTYPLYQHHPTTPEGKPISHPSASDIRRLAGQVLQVLVNEFGNVYETLVPRLTKTLLRSLAPPNPPGRVEGALLGLAAIGKEGLRKGLWGDIGFRTSKSRTREPGGVGVKAWGEVWEREPWRPEERDAVIRAGVATLSVLLPTPRPPPMPLTDPNFINTLTIIFGPTFAPILATDQWLSEGLVNIVSSARDRADQAKNETDGNEDELIVNLRTSRQQPYRPTQPQPHQSLPPLPSVQTGGDQTEKDADGDEDMDEDMEEIN